MPQALQLSGSLVRSLQPSLQQMLLPAHVAPPLQRHWPEKQVLPLVHGGLHCDGTQWPVMHAWPAGHCVLQSPQCCGSFDGSKQPAPPGEPPGQQTWLPVQLLPPLHVHEPCWHASPILQLWLQPPQFIALCVVQVPPQHSWPGEHGVVPHKHCPPEQTSPARQRCPHAPQLLGSLVVLAQPDGQQLSPAAQMAPLHAQAPLAQTNGVVHVWPHVPQLPLLVRVSMQVVPQQTSGDVQNVVPHGHCPFVEHMPFEQHSPLVPQAAVVPHLQTPATHDSPGLQA